MENKKLDVNELDEVSGGAAGGIDGFWASVTKGELMNKLWALIPDEEKKTSVRTYVENHNLQELKGFRYHAKENINVVCKGEEITVNGQSIFKN